MGEDSLFSGLGELLKSPGGQSLLAGAFGALSGRGTRAQAIGQGGLAGLLAYGRATDNQADMARQKMQDDRQSQMFEMQMAQHRAAQEARQRKQGFLSSLGGGLSAADALSSGGGPTVANAAKIGQRKPFNPTEALTAGFSPAEAKELASMPDWGASEVARTVEVDDGQGGKATVQLDRFGRPVGQSLPGYVAPVQVDTGGGVQFVRPSAGVKLTKTMTPEGRDASARGWQGLKIQQENADRDAFAVTYQTDGSGNLVAMPTRVKPGQAVRPIPVRGADGAPVAGKLPEAKAKELLSIDQQRASIEGALRAVEQTPSAFSMGRGLATLSGTIPESLAGRIDSDAERKARSYVFNNVSAVINERAGAAQSAQEMARLRSFLPGETDNAEQVKSKLEGFRDYLAERERGVGVNRQRSNQPPAAPSGVKFLGFE